MERNQITRIKGLSERRRLPRLGKVRLGLRVKTTTGKEYPRETSWFVCPPEVQKIYGDQPTELDIMFPIEDECSCFPQALKWYGNTVLKCKGDGEMALRRWEDCTPEQQAELGNGREPNELVEVSCPCEKLDERKCSQSGNLMVLLPKISIGGVYQIDTGSGSNIISINSYIDYLRAITGGRIALIPLKLRRVEQKMSYIDEKGENRSSIHYLLQLELKITLEELDRSRRDRIAIPTVHYQLPSPVEDGRDIPEVIVDEEDIEKQPETTPILNDPPKTNINAPEVPPEPIGKEAGGQGKGDKGKTTTEIDTPKEKQNKAIRASIHANHKSVGVTDEEYFVYLQKMHKVDSSLEITDPEILREIMMYFNPKTFNMEMFKGTVSSADLPKELKPQEDPDREEKLAHIETLAEELKSKEGVIMMYVASVFHRKEETLQDRIENLPDENLDEMVSYLEGLKERK
ncbi:MAG: hypothetical protein WC623_24215 [Pedobacter sp.]|uniref:recombination directionality factor n=1 Tax=Pedobacter sp. TaxID=1411316 RepID=UPI003563D4D9